MMVDYAFKQLNEAVLKWESLATIDQESLEERSEQRNITHRRQSENLCAFNQPGEPGREARTEKL
jgi:hypothetical protein